MEGTVCLDCCVAFGVSKMLINLVSSLFLFFFLTNAVRNNVHFENSSVTVAEHGSYIFLAHVYICFE